jgi:lipopolysaccharide transport system permease protein
MLLAYGYPLSLSVLVTVPLLTLLMVTITLSMTFWLSALNVRFRDVRYLVPFLLQIWMFATPIAYPSSLITEPWRTFYGLNPMVTVIEGFRWALRHNTALSPILITLSVIVALVGLISGLVFFHRAEAYFSDIV